MAIFNLFSKRQADQANAGKADVYQYTVIPEFLRVQLRQISVDAIGYVGAPGGFAGLPSQENPFWEHINDTFCREKGFEALDNSQFKGEQVQRYMARCSTADGLDLLELIGYAMVVSEADEFRQQRYEWKIPNDQADNMAEINHRLRQAGVGFQLQGSELLKVNSQYVHAEVVIPALTLLNHRKFRSANEEFRKAHKEFRDGDYRNCITDCGKALESVLKVIASERGWQGVGDNSQLAPLIKASADNGLLSSYMPEQLNGIKAMVQGAGTVRNKDGAHGQGTKEVKADEALAAYQLHQTAAAIIFIADRDRATG